MGMEILPLTIVIEHSFLSENILQVLKTGFGNTKEDKDILKKGEQLLRLAILGRKEKTRVWRTFSEVLDLEDDEVKVSKLTDFSEVLNNLKMGQLLLNKRDLVLETTAFFTRFNKNCSDRIVQEMSSI